VVVGPPGEEIFTDKYGRVKVQFHWDRQGKYNADSSCWIRVGTTWAGKQWGFIQIPSIGQEVIVDFLEGDPDQPIIIGSVYNAEMIPPSKLPDKKMCSGMKSNSTPGGGGYNEISIDDTKGEEKITLHGQYDMNTTVEHDHSLTVHRNRSITVDGTHTETIKKETKITISDENYTLDVAKGTSTHHVKGAVAENYDDTQTTTVEKKIDIKSNKADIAVTAATQILLHCGESSILLKENGTIEVKGKVVTIDGSENVKLQSAKKAEVVSDKETVMGVGDAQTVKCDTAAVTTCGAAINTCADGTHTITGSLVKIN
jgi:type VI secretion system secreted protein VgrG